MENRIMESIPKKSGIYQIRNLINGKVYIGSSVNLHVRALAHFNSLKRNAHENQKLQRAYNKYGLDKLVFEVLEYVEKDTLLEREQYYIDTLNAVNEGYNICPVAKHTVDWVWTPAQRKSRCGAGNPMYGKHHSEEHKKRISDAEKGRIPWNKGRKMTESERLQVREYNGNSKRVQCIETEIIFFSVSEAGRQYQIKPSNISACARGERKTAGGYHWVYV